MALNRQAQPDQVIIPDLDTVRASAQNIRTAFKNRAFFSSSVTLPTQTTAGMNLTLATCLLNVKASGIFQAGFDYAFTGGSNAATFDFQVQTQTVASGLTQSAAGTKVGPGMGAATNGAFYANAAGGIVITGGGGTLLQYDTGSQTLLTGILAATGSWTSIIQNSITATTETPFTIGSQILLQILLNTSAAITFRGFSIWLNEIGG